MIIMKEFLKEFINKNKNGYVAIYEILGDSYNEYFVDLESEVRFEDGFIIFKPFNYYDRTIYTCRKCGTVYQRWLDVIKKSFCGHDDIDEEDILKKVYANYFISFHTSNAKYEFYE